MSRWYASMGSSQDRGAVAWGVALLVFGVVVLFLSGWKVATAPELAELRGQLASLEKTTSRGGGLSSIRFSINTDVRHLQYVSTQDAIDSVWFTLERAGRAELTVMVDTSGSPAPLLDRHRFHTVYELRLDGRTIRSYPEVTQALDANQLLGRALGWISVLAGIVMFAMGAGIRLVRPHT